MKSLTHSGGGISLRVKLVLSYLGVALGAILLMVIVVSIAVQNYFYQSQIDQLRAQTEGIALNAAQEYQHNNNSWDGLEINPKAYLFFSSLLITDAHGNLLTPQLPAELNPYENILEQALTNALQGKESAGALQGNTDNDGNSNDGGSSNASNASNLYVGVPILSNNQVVGAIILVQPNHYPRGFSPYEFLANVNLVILIAGLGITLIVIAFSLFMTRRLTRPLISLTLAAEEMKAGNYARRVEQPQNLDELGRLATTFNSMADKIQSDVTELRQQEQLRRDLIANIAHDLVTPLTAIQGYSEAIADDVIVDSEERHETAQLIGREVQRLRRLVSDMQQMTSLEAGRVQLEMAPLNLLDLVTETLAVIAPECEQAQIELRNWISPTTPLAMADSDRLTQVLLNLLDNARRHTPAGGQITLGAKAEGEWLMVWVSDTGVGINPQDLPYIFERFYRVDRSRSAASGGSGLGLAIIKAIIGAHGGTVWAQSKLGQGTTIFFSLRRVASLPTVTLKPEIKEPASSNL
jgi:two-component system, OmpR family, sensor histidine kinase BaeS